jgi:hypothetical protein
MAEHAAATNSGLVLNDAQYDVLRRFVELIFPGLGALYAALAILWGWDYSVQVVGSATALTVFGGVVLKFARQGYVPASPTIEALNGGFDGAVVEDTVDGRTVLRVDLDDSAAADILNREQLVIKGYDVSA